MGYREEYNNWQTDPEAYWLKAAQSIDWEEPPNVRYLSVQKIFMNGSRNHG